MSQFSRSIGDPMLRNAIEIADMLGAIIAAPDRPQIYPYVREYLALRPGEWVSAQEIVDASNDFFSLGGVGAAMGSLHDAGEVTTIGVAGQHTRRAKWDATCPE